MAQFNFQDMAVELEVPCHCQVPGITEAAIRSVQLQDIPDYDETIFLNEDTCNLPMKKHVFANVWERSLDPRGLREDQPSPDIWTIDWRQWPPPVPQVPAGLKIPVELVYNTDLQITEAIPLSCYDTDFYTGMKGLLNTVQTSSVSVQPPALLFLHSKVGQFYSVKLRLKNIDSIPRRVKIIPPRSACFEVVWGSDTNTLVPGLSVSIAVHFRPNSNKSVNEILFIAVEGDGGLTVPLVSASAPPPMLEIDEFDCGCSVVSNPRTEIFTIKNQGGVGRFWFLTEEELENEYLAFQMERDSKGSKRNSQSLERPQKKRGSRLYKNPFKIKPSCFKLLRNQKIEIKVKYTPKSIGLHYEKIAVMCDNAQIRWIAAKGMGVDIRSSSLTELQATPAWTAPPVDLAVDPNCRYCIDLGDLLMGNTATKELKLINKSCIPLYFFWSVRPLLVSEPDKNYKENISFQQFFEGSLQPLEGQDYSHNWTNEAQLLDPAIDVKIYPSQGILHSSQELTFKISVPCPALLGYFGCVISVFVEQVDEKSISVINPFICNLEEDGLNDIPIHFDDLKKTMPKDHLTEQPTEADGDNFTLPGITLSKNSMKKEHRKGSKNQNCRVSFTKEELESLKKTVVKDAENKRCCGKPDSDDNINTKPVYMMRHVGQGHDKLDRLLIGGKFADDLQDALLEDNCDDATNRVIEALLKNPENCDIRLSLQRNWDDGRKASSVAAAAAAAEAAAKNEELEAGNEELEATNAYLYEADGEEEEETENEEMEEHRESKGAVQPMNAKSTHSLLEFRDASTGEIIPSVRVVNEIQYILKPETKRVMRSKVDAQGDASNMDELKTYEEMNEVAETVSPLKNAALLPIAECEIWLRSVPLNVTFTPPFIIAVGSAKTTAEKNVSVFNDSEWSVEVKLNTLMSTTACIMCNPSTFTLGPRQKCTLKATILFERHGKVFQDLMGSLRVCSSTLEAPCAIACSISTSGPFLLALTPIINFGIMKMSCERMKTIAIRNIGEKVAKWTAYVASESLKDEHGRNLSPKMQTIQSMKLLRVWPEWGMIDPKETLGINVYFSGEIQGPTAATVHIKVEGNPDSSIFIPIIAEVQSPYLVLEESEIHISRETIRVNKVEDALVTLYNPTGFAVSFCWQTCLIGRQRQLVAVEFCPQTGFVHPRGTMDCIINITPKSDVQLRNVYAMCIVDTMKEPLILKISSD